MNIDETTAGVVPEPANSPDSGTGTDESKKNTDQPLTGEATERQAPWRPADQPSAHELYEDDPAGERSGDAESDGRGI